MIAQMACWLAVSLTGQDHFYPPVFLVTPPNAPAQLYYQDTKEPFEPARESPKKFGEDKQPWQFPWMVAGFSHVAGDPIGKDLKFRVYSQEQKGNRAVQVTRMLLRLWTLNVERLRLIHNPRYHGGLVDVFLCFGGKAGGEQLFDQELGRDSITGKDVIYDANTIYIYDMPSFTDPVEMAREIAHEYGHATWPPKGGFKEPEEWSDGYLAEKVYLRWIRDALANNTLTPDDVMGATKAGLDKWIATNVDPLVMNASQIQPTTELLADKSKAGMNAFIGLAVYLETIYPASVFARSMKLGTYEAKDYPPAAVLAAEEPDQITLKIPASLSGKSLWIPLGTGKISGAKILKSDPNGWVQIQPTGSVVITNVH